MKRERIIVLLMVLVSLAGGFLLSRSPSFFPVSSMPDPQWTVVDIQEPAIHFEMPGTPTHSITTSDSGEKIGTFASAWPESTHFLVRMTKVDEKTLSDDMRRKHEVDEHNITDGIHTKGISFFHSGYVCELLAVYPDGQFSEENYQRFISSFSVLET